MTDNASVVSPLQRIFFPIAVDGYERAVKGMRFAYYTTAGTAYKILENAEIWMPIAWELNRQIFTHCNSLEAKAS
jgi:hypothetical protein